MSQTAVSDNQSSSVTLNELAKKARKIYCNFEFQRRSHTMTEINLNRAQITKTGREYFLRFLLYMDMAATLVMLPVDHLYTLSFPLRKEAPHKIWL